MGAVPLVRASAFLPFLGFLRSVGAPVDQRLNAVLVPQKALEDPETLVPLNQALLFLDRNAAAEGLLDLGIQAAGTTSVVQLGALGRLICQSLTLYDALCKASRLLPLFNSAQRIWLEPWRSTYRVCHQFTDDRAIGREFGDQFTLMLLIDCIRMAAGPKWWPAEIHLEHDTWRTLNGRSGLFGGCPIHRGNVSAVVFEHSLLALPLAFSRHETNGPGLSEYRVFQSSAPGANFSVSVKQVVQSLLKDRKFQVGHIAAVAGMSARTFQRRLAENGSDFSSLVDRARFDACTDLIADPHNSLTDIAYELGFAETASFTRAFRRWTGITPSEYRRLRGESRV